jgi:hypothetical protein
MRTQKQLEKILTTINLLGLALGFSALGLLIVAKEHNGAPSPCAMVRQKPHVVKVLAIERREGTRV